MFKYRSKCRWNMLLCIDGEVIEIRPSELFESKTLVESRYLELIEEEVKEEFIKELVEESPKKKKIKD